jgi:putative ABC transport system permease protein
MSSGFEKLVADLRFSARMLCTNPGLALITILILSLGIGGTTAVFSYVNAILLKPLPYREPHRLVMLSENNLQNGWRRVPAAPVIFAEWRDHASVFESLSVRGWGGFILTGSGIPENLEGALVSVNTFTMVGVRPILGRDFLPEEGTLAKSHVVLISNKLWRLRFGGERMIIGRSIVLNDEPYTVIGVMPSDVYFPNPNTQIWIPQIFSADEFQDRHRHMYEIYGRLKPDATIQQAGLQLDLLSKQRAELDPQSKGWGAEVVLLRDVIVGDSHRILLLLLGCVGVVLLIGCANIANLLLVHSSKRRGEFAVRIALGASRRELIRQLVSESLLVAILGGSGGIVAAHLILAILRPLTPSDLPRVWEGVRVDGGPLVFALIIALSTGVFCWLVPALQSTASGVVRLLNETARSAGSGRRRQKLRSALVVCEVGLSIVLLTGALLLLQSFHLVLRQNLGYRLENRIAMTIGRPDGKGQTFEDRNRFFETLLTQIRTWPELRSSALVRGLPLREKFLRTSRISGSPPPLPGQATMTTGFAHISPGYFRVMGIPLLQGRDFDEFDRTNTQPVVIVDERFVKNLYLGDHPLGKAIELDDGGEKLEIIGVVRETKNMGPTEAARGEIYRTFGQTCPHQMTLVVSTRSPISEVTRLVRAEIDHIDKDQPIGNVTTLDQLLDLSVGQRRWVMQLLGVFAGASIFLTSIGLYGVLSATVAQRTPEIGLRLALGAQSTDITRMVVRQGMSLTGIGMLIGVAVWLTCAQVLRSFLFRVSPTDPAIITAVVVFLALIALAACYLPSRRAANVEPIRALKL